MEEFGEIGMAFDPSMGAKLWEAFIIFDDNGDSKISVEELLGVFVMLGDEGCMLEDCRRMINGVNMDDDSFVCFQEREKGFGRARGRRKMRSRGCSWVL